MASVCLSIKSNRICFGSFDGNQYTCNPKYICEYLEQKYPGKYEIVWCLNNADDISSLTNRNYKFVKEHSLRMHYYMYTSACIIRNDYNPIIPKKNQIAINTWHGGGYYKKVRLDNNYSSRFTHMISSSKTFSEKVIRDAFCFHGEIIEIGQPRNDILFSDTSELRKAVLEKLNLDTNAHIVLYAPTYRLSEITEPNYDLVRKAYYKRFGVEPMILIHGHRNAKYRLGDDKCMDVTDYHDMQELLVISNMLISDYSSTIWDYSFLYRPCFLYVPDLEEYKQNPGLESDIYTWGFPVCNTMDELVDKIMCFDVIENQNAMNKHHDSLGSFETGNACERIVDIIVKRCT